MSGNKKGFSLIEMIVVISIIGIIYAIASPMLSRYNIRKKLIFEGQKVGEVLDVARSTANTRRERTIFERTGDQFFYRLEGDTFPQDKKHRLDSSVGFNASSPSSLTFNVTGSLSGVSGDQIVTLDGGNRKQLDITVNQRTGRVTVGEIY